MLQLVNLLVDICLLRRGPQHLPARRELTLFLIVAYGALAAAAEAWLGEPSQAFQWSVTSMVMLVGFIYGLLRWRGLLERFDQTVSAVAGCGVVYLLVYLPLSAALATPEGEPTSALAPLLVLVWILVFFWGFIIEGHIYRHALRLPLPGGVLVSVLIFAAANGLYRQFFAAP
ncbi:MAG: hypothetical protein AAGE01_17060 [Pseudomonadota bacterium]